MAILLHGHSLKGGCYFTPQYKFVVQLGGLQFWTVIQVAPIGNAFQKVHIRFLKVIYALNIQHSLCIRQGLTHAEIDTTGSKNIRELDDVIESVIVSNPAI